MPIPLSVLRRHAPDALLGMLMSSEANFSGWADPRGVELEVSRIMYPSPRAEADQLVGGAFHHFERYFLRYLEGPRHALESLHQRAANDARHKNVSILRVEKIGRRTFSPGTMSYAGIRTELFDLKRHRGVDSFNPRLFTEEMICDVLALFRGSFRARAARA
ncbi:MAG: BLUF domain-containing protein [Wenzhouxiangellaceae bacterium]|nr:BLUF domain-containing protein [Wenzhouxiangellaceae bacterium]